MCLMLLIYYKLHRNPADAAQSVPQVFISQKTNFLSREPSDLFSPWDEKLAKTQIALEILQVMLYLIALCY